MSKKFEYQNPEPDEFMPYVLWLGVFVMIVFFVGSMAYGYYKSIPRDEMKQDQQAILSRIAEVNNKLK